MALRKCPKCELNYIKSNETICRICAAEMDKKRSRKNADSEDEIVMCTECGERPAVHGKDLCEECLKEQQRQADLELHADAVRAAEMEDPIEIDESFNVDGIDEE